MSSSANYAFDLAWRPEFLLQFSNYFGESQADLQLKGDEGCCQAASYRVIGGFGGAGASALDAIAHLIAGLVLLGSFIWVPASIAYFLADEGSIVQEFAIYCNLSQGLKHLVQSVSSAITIPFALGFGLYYGPVFLYRFITQQGKEEVQKIEDGEIQSQSPSLETEEKRFKDLCNLSKEKMETSDLVFQVSRFDCLPVELFPRIFGDFPNDPNLHGMIKAHIALIKTVFSHDFKKCYQVLAHLIDRKEWDIRNLPLEEDDFAEVLPYLTYVKFNGKSKNNVISEPEVRILPSSYLCEILARCDNVKILHLNHCDMSELPNLIHLTELHTLQIENCTQLNDNSFENLESIHKLSSFTLVTDRNTPLDPILKQLGKCKALKRIDLDGGKLISKSLDHLKIENMIQIFLRKVQKFDKSNFDVLSKAINLESLMIVQCSNPVSATWVSQLESCTKLKEFLLNGVQSSELAQACQKLRKKLGINDP